MKEAGSEWAPDPGNRDENLFDSFARHAADSLRSPAPEDGIGAVVRQGTRQRTRRLAIEIGVVGALVVTGVALLDRSERTERNLDTPPQPTTQTTVALVPTPIASAADIKEWFLDYTGNPAGPATGEPVKFGVVMSAFPYRYQLGVAADYLNEQAGGVGGRPIELDICIEDLTVCADRFAADSAVVAVLENGWFGDKSDGAYVESVGTALAGRKPLHTTYSNSGTSGVAYYPSYRETAIAMTLQAKKLTAPGERVLVIGGSSRTPDTSGLEGRDVIVVRAGEGPLVDAIRNAGATEAEAVVLAAPPFASAQVHAPDGRVLCDEFTDALDQLGMHAAAVVVATCEPREGWYKVDVGFNETSPSLVSGALSITTEMPHLGETTAGPPDRDVREAGALLAAIRLINELGGPAQASPAALDQAMRDFTGPLPLGAGPLDCSPTGLLAERMQRGGCVRFIDVYQFIHDAWIDVAPIDLGA